MPSGPELYIVIAVVVLLFGGAKLPALARSLGQAKNEFDKGTKDEPAVVPEHRTEVVPPTR